MTAECRRYEADWELAVLGLLAERALSEMQQHLEGGCAKCRTRFHDAQLLLSAVAKLAPEPAVSATAALTVKGRIRRRWTLAPWIAVAVSLALAAWLGYDRGRLSNELAVAHLPAAMRQELEVPALVRVLQSPCLKQVELAAPDSIGGTASARALMARDSGLLVVARRLPVLPANKCYQLWIVRKSGPAIVSAGLLATDERGSGILYAPPSESLTVATGFAITDEPAGGSAAAKGHKLLYGAI